MYGLQVAALFQFGDMKLSKNPLGTARRNPWRLARRAENQADLADLDLAERERVALADLLLGRLAHCSQEVLTSQVRTELEDRR